jgi:hypothetical protein
LRRSAKTAIKERSRKSTAHAHASRISHSSPDANELRANLYSATKKPYRTVIGRKVYILHVEVNIDPAPELDLSVAPPFSGNRVSIWYSSKNTSLISPYK